MSKHRLASIALLFLATAALPACSDDNPTSSGSGGGGGAGGAGGGTGGGGDGGGGGDVGIPGTIVLHAQGITGASGQVLLGLEPGEASSVCAPVTSDPFEYTGPLLEWVGTDNPCDLTETPHVFSAGTHTLSLGIYTPGQQTADKCATVNVDVTVDAAAMVDAPAFDTWSTTCP